jgi:hypothetical protein
MIFNVRGLKDTEVFISNFTDHLLTKYPAEFNVGKKVLDLHSLLGLVLRKVASFSK